MSLQLVVSGSAGKVRIIRSSSAAACGWLAIFGIAPFRMGEEN
jgi:hypothetical protein